MSSQKPLRLTHWFELPHPSLPYPSRLLRLLCPITLILLSAENRLWAQLPMRDAIGA